MRQALNVAPPAVRAEGLPGDHDQAKFGAFPQLVETWRFNGYGSELADSSTRGNDAHGGNVDEHPGQGDWKARDWNGNFFEQKSLNENRRVQPLLR